MSSELEGRVARLERAYGAALGSRLSEFDDKDQAEARIKQDAKNQEAENKLIEQNVQDALARQAAADEAAERQLALEETARSQETQPPAPTRSRRKTSTARRKTSSARRKAKRSTDQPALKQRTATGKKVSGQDVETKRGIRDVTTPPKNAATGGGDD